MFYYKADLSWAKFCGQKWHTGTCPKKGAELRALLFKVLKKFSQEMDRSAAREMIEKCQSMGWLRRVARLKRSKGIGLIEKARL